MPNDITSIRALCPFWLYSTGCSICCEGLMTDKVVQRFPTSFSRCVAEERYCQRDWESCPHAQSVWSLYDEDGNLILNIAKTSAPK